MCGTNLGVIQQSRYISGIHITFQLTRGEDSVTNKLKKNC